MPITSVLRGQREEDLLDLLAASVAPSSVGNLIAENKVDNEFDALLWALRTPPYTHTKMHTCHTNILHTYILHMHTNTHTQKFIYPSPRYDIATFVVE